MRMAGHSRGWMCRRSTRRFLVRSFQSGGAGRVGWSSVVERANIPRVLVDRCTAAVRPPAGRPGPCGECTGPSALAPRVSPTIRTAFRSADRTAAERRFAGGVARACPTTPATASWRLRLVAGDEGALREAYRADAAAVHGLALRVLSNEALAEEVVQDVFVRLWEQPGRFEPSSVVRSARSCSPMTHSRAVRAGAFRGVAAPPARGRRRAPAPVDLDDDPARAETRDADTRCEPRFAVLPDAGTANGSRSRWPTSTGCPTGEVARAARRSRRDREIPHPHGNAEAARRARESVEVAP